MLGGVLLDKQAGLWVEIGARAGAHVVLTRQGCLWPRGTVRALSIVFCLFELMVNLTGSMLVSCVEDTACASRGMRPLIGLCACVVGLRGWTGLVVSR